MIGKLRTTAAARVIGIHPDTLKQWRYKKIGPPYTLSASGQAIYDEIELREWLQSRAVSA